jgi:serine/threonine protein phosphatase PrpC
MKLATGSATDTGLVRGNNEDAFLVDGAHQLFAVADGMGGHRGGEVASRTAIEALRAAIASGYPVNEAIARANAAVLERAAGDTELTGMGTTMTALVVADGQQLLIGHVGDSRAYLLHNGVLRRITDDHSLVEELVREGRLTPEQAESHPQRHVVTRGLGVDADVEVDLITIEVIAGDRVVICSDGLTTMVRERDIERLVRNEPDPQRAAELLVDAANRAGGEDNTSIVVVDVVEVDDVEVPVTEGLAPTEALAAPAAPAPSPGHRPAMRPAPEPPAPTPPRAPAASWGSRIRGTLLLFVPLILVLGIAVGGVGYYARRSYYVGFATNRVVIYKGVPGGVLGWDPTIEQPTRLTAGQLTQIDRDRVAAGGGRGSLSHARQFVANLQAHVNATSTTTTTTKPRVTTKTTARPTTSRPRAATVTTP